VSNTSNNETVNIKDKIEFENRDEKNIPAEEEIGANKIIGSVINSMKKYNALTDANLPNTNK